MNLDNNSNEDLFKTVEFNPNQIKAEIQKQAIKEKIEDNDNIDNIDSNGNSNNSKKTMTKKQKITIISLSVGVVILLGVLIYYLFAKNITEDKPKPQASEGIIIEKDNYKYENGTLIFLNSEDEEMGRYECENKDVTSCYVAYEIADDDFSTTKYIYEDETPIKIRSKIYQNRYVFIRDRKEEDEDFIFLYDFKDNKKLENYLGVKSYSNSLFKNEEINYVFVKNSDANYGIISLENSSVETKVDYKFAYLGKIVENKSEDDKLLVASTIDNNKVKYSIIDYKGKNVSKSLDNKIKNYNDKYIVVINSAGKYDVYDYAGTRLFGDFDYAKLVNDYLVTIIDKEYNLIDLEGYSLISSKIQLNNDYFDPVIVYDENLAKLDTRRSFLGGIENNTLNLTVYKENNEKDEYSISLFEGIVSKNLDKYTYFDGKLYFYDDVEKTTLLGTYECTNRNKITSATSELNNCHIAVDTPTDDNDYIYEKLGSMSSPVFFKRYVFVYDSPDLVNDETREMYVVDLKTGKKNGPYTELKFENGIRDNSLTDYITTYVVAKSEGKYGIIAISSNKVGMLNGVKTEYDHIDIANNNFIALKDGQYGVYDFSGKKSTLSNANKIMSFEKQLLLYAAKDNDNNYTIYNKDNIKVGAEEPYKYVYFEGTYIMVVLQNGNIDVLTLQGESILDGAYYNIPSSYEYGTKINYNNLYIEFLNSKIVFKLRSDESFIHEIVITE